MPAQLMTVVISPWEAANSASAFTEARSEVSQGCAIALIPRLSSSFTAWSSLLTVRPDRITVFPFMNFAVSRPMPEPPPVMTHIFSVAEIPFHIVFSACSLSHSFVNQK